MARPKKETVTEVTHIKAEIEQRAGDGRGNKTSEPIEQYFNPQDWETFRREFGKRIGWFVNKIIEAPEGTNLEYTQPGDKDPTVFKVQ